MLDLDLNKLLPRPAQFVLLGVILAIGLGTAAQHIATVQITPLADALEAHKQAHEAERTVLYQKLDALQDAMVQLEIHVAELKTREDDHP